MVSGFSQELPKQNNLKFSNIEFVHLSANGIYSSTITRRVHVNYTAKRSTAGMSIGQYTIAVYQLIDF